MGEILEGNISPNDNIVRELIVIAGHSLSGEALCSEWIFVPEL